MKEKLMAQIQRYNPVNEQEETDKETLQDLLKKAASRGLWNGSIQNW